MSQKCAMWPPSHNAPRHLGTKPAPKHGLWPRTTFIVYNWSTRQSWHIRLELGPTTVVQKSKRLFYEYTANVKKAKNHTPWPPISVNGNVKCPQRVNTPTYTRVTPVVFSWVYTHKNTYTFCRLVMPWMLSEWVIKVQISSRLRQDYSQFHPIYCSVRHVAQYRQ